MTHRPTLVKAFGLVMLLALALGSVSSAAKKPCNGYNSPASCGKEGPKLTLQPVPKQTLKTVKADGLKLTARCSRACSAKLSASVGAKGPKKGRRAKPRVQVGTVTKALTAGKKTVVAIPVTLPDRPAFKRARAVKLVVVGRATDGAGIQGKRVTKVVTIKRDR